MSKELTGSNLSNEHFLLSVYVEEQNPQFPIEGEHYKAVPLANSYNRENHKFKIEVSSGDDQQTDNKIIVEQPLYLIPDLLVSEVEIPDSEALASYKPSENDDPDTALIKAMALEDVIFTLSKKPRGEEDGLAKIESLFQDTDPMADLKAKNEVSSGAVAERTRIFSWGSPDNTPDRARAADYMAAKSLMDCLAECADKELASSSNEWLGNARSSITIMLHEGLDNAPDEIKAAILAPVAKKYTEAGLGDNFRGLLQGEDNSYRTTVEALKNNQEIVL